VKGFDATKNELVNGYVEILAKWNKTINLIQKQTMADVFNRHIADSVQISKFLKPDDYILDVGTGAGFPGVILSILGFNNIILCEKDFKKHVFLRDVKSRLGLSFSIFNDDVHNFNVSRETFSKPVIVSRAFGSLTKLLNVMVHLKLVRGVFHKGAKHMEEIENALNVYAFDYTVNASQTNENGAIIIAENVRRK
jgi:16S rRNA (guanine527-N7)-methyltransferase